MVTDRHRFMIGAITAVFAIVTIGICAFLEEPTAHVLKGAAMNMQTTIQESEHIEIQNSILTSSHDGHHVVNPAVLPDTLLRLSILLFAIFLVYIRRSFFSTEKEERLHFSLKYHLRVFLEWCILLPIVVSLRRGIIHPKLYT